MENPLPKQKRQQTRSLGVSQKEDRNSCHNWSKLQQKDAAARRISLRRLFAFSVVIFHPNESSESMRETKLPVGVPWYICVA